MQADDKSTSDNLIVSGFKFTSEADAQKALTDESKIKLLDSRFKVSKPSDIKAVYEKALENKIFKTPIGWMYLYNLRKKLLESGFSEEDIIPIPVEVSFTRHSAFEGLTVKQRVTHTEENKKDFRRIFSLTLNVALIIVVIIMFIIAITGETDNIINYKSNVTNRYAAWEQDLKEREKAVRIAEKRLGIEDTSSYYEDTEEAQEE
jgi:hypothetical protein